MSWALFWFLCVVGLSIALARSLRENTISAIESRSYRITRDRFCEQVHELLEAKYRLKWKVDKYRQVVTRLQAALSKCRSMNSKLRSELVEMTIERNRLREEIEEKNKKRSFHMS